MPTFGRRSDRKERIGLLVVCAVSSVLLWQTTFGSFLLYPFTILATWFHEMGHGLAAMLTGNSFEKLLIFPDGSGLARSSRDPDGYSLTDAFISAGGPLGPALAGSGLILASRYKDTTKSALLVLGLSLLLSTAIWVRSLTGWIVLPVMGVLILALAVRGSATHQRLAIQILGVQAAISVWQQFDYLFSAGAVIDGQSMRSDTSAIAEALFFPYWFWGSALSGVINALLWWSLRRALR
jgi:hypothetical protein